MKRVPLVAAMILFLIASFPTLTTSQWSEDPDVNTPICAAVADQTGPVAVSDGKGGIIVAWVDKRISYPLVYVQRIDGNGFAKWAKDGIPIWEQTEGQRSPSIVEDDSGGAYVSWMDSRYGHENLLVQRIDSNGVRHWPVVGLSLASDILSYAAQRDFQGGAVYGLPGPKLQRVAPDGTTYWVGGGISICGSHCDGSTPAISTDREGTTFASWGTFAQRVTAGGQLRWTSNGQPLQIGQNFVCDGRGGLVSATVEQGLSQWFIVLRRVDSVGFLVRTALLDSGASALNLIVTGVVPSYTGGAHILSGLRPNLGLAPDYYLTTFGANGTLSRHGTWWGSSGALPRIYPDGLGEPLVLARLATANCLVMWKPTSTKFGTFGGTHVQSGISAVTDGAGGAIVVWEDGRNGADSDIYAHVVRYTPTGVLSNRMREPGAFVLDPCYPNPFNASTVIRYELPHPVSVTLEVFNPLGQLLATLVHENKAAGVHTVVFDASGMASGVYFGHFRAGAFVAVGKLVLVR
jgi:hypothetical protein